jgi:transcription antitermination factor NusG
MNERIFELAKQADLIQWDSLPSGARTPDHESVVKARKFAELIVRECVSVAMEQYDDTLPWGGVEDVLKHFGVESTSIKVGSRVKVVSGFNVGVKGTVSYIEPTGKMWVMRDDASTDVFYHPEEVIGVGE